MTGSDSKLRIGLLVASELLPLWAYRMLEQIQQSEYAVIVQVVEKAGASQEPILLGRVTKYLLNCLKKLESFKNNIETDPTESISIRTAVQSSSWIGIEPVLEDGVSQLAKSDLDRLRNDQVDVYIDLNFGAVPEEFSALAAHGVWFVGFGSEYAITHQCPGFKEVHAKDPVTEVSLQILSVRPRGNKVIRRAYLKTNELYVSRNRASMCWKAASMIPRALARLYTLGSKSFYDSVETQAPNQRADSTSRQDVLAWRDVLVVGLRHFVRPISRFIQNRIWFEQWILLFNRSTSINSNQMFDEFERLTPPKDRFWADPFVVDYEGEYHLFFEELLYETGKGHISHLRINSEGTPSEPRIVLTRPYHLSYPFLLEHDDNLYMIPESAENKTVDLYRCVRFPNQWKFERSLLSDIEAVDATIIEHQGRWWLFANVRESKYGSYLDELFLYSSDNILTGDWVPHPLNPVVSDARVARPAGKIFREEGHLVRPAQDCSGIYGGSMKLQRIDQLSPNEYSECTIREIVPGSSPYVVGMHTINRSNDLIVIDALIRRSKFSA